MKFCDGLYTLIIGVALIFGAHTANAAQHMDIVVKGEKAKQLYNLLTGSAVQNEGAAGHLYRTGKDVLCRYTNADMTNKHGHAVPAHSSCRYACSIQFNHNGQANPGPNP